MGIFDNLRKKNNELKIKEIIAKDYKQKYFYECKEIWKNYVPKNGQAENLQGELLREIEKLRYEAQDNGNINWDEDYSYFCDFISKNLCEQSIFSESEKKEIAVIMSYKEEKIGLNWMIAEVSSKEDSSKTARVYARNTGYFKDDYHIYYYRDEIKKRVEPLCKEKDYIQKCETEIEGHTTPTEWTGKETLEKYVDKAEYTAILRIYLQEGKTDRQYAEEILDCLKTLAKTDYNIRLIAKTEETKLSIFDEELGAKNKDISKYSMEWLLEEIPHTRDTSMSIRKYKEWKKQNQK